MTEILKAHPDYEKWEKSFTSESANLDLPTFIFIRSSTWADEIRRHGNHYDQPHRHYVDYLVQHKPVVTKCDVNCATRSEVL